MVDQSLKNFILPVLTEMVNDRGYLTVEDISEDTILCSNNPNSKDIVVKILDQEKVSVDAVRQIVQSVTCSGIGGCILTFVNIPSPQVKTFLNDLSHTNIVIELFGKYELGFNVTKHKLVPKHILLTPEEKKVVTKLYGVKNIPQIKSSDPLAKYFGAKKGDVFHIIRKIGMTYRITV
jgi:DNA-directed RNA polymerase I, II, and III subunit RPABC1